MFRDKLFGISSRILNLNKFHLVDPDQCLCWFKFEMRVRVLDYLNTYGITCSVQKCRKYQKQIFIIFNR